MNDDEIIRERIDDRSAARAHRGGPPILVIIGGLTCASRRSPKSLLQGSDGRSKTAKRSTPK
jgi:hypothetical protein